MGFKITYLSTNVFTTFQFTKVRLFNSRKVEFDTYTHLDKTTYGDWNFRFFFNFYSQIFPELDISVSKIKSEGTKKVDR